MATTRPHEDRLGTGGSAGKVLTHTGTGIPAYTTISGGGGISYTGVAGVTASSSNTLTGQVDLRPGTGIAFAVSSNTITISDLVSLRTPPGTNTDFVLGEKDGVPLWGSRYKGVDAVTSSSSNTVTGQVDIRGSGATVTLSSNTLTIGAASLLHTHGPQTSALLSTIHTDTVPASPVRGDLIAASSNAVWSRMASAGADALTSDRFLGETPQGDPQWRPRFYGVDALTSSSSNTLRGQVDLRVSGMTVSLSSNTLTLEGTAPGHTHGQTTQTSALLSSVHIDTTPATVVRGDMIAATSNATWKRQPTPTADALTSDRFLGTINGDPHWRPRYYGVDSVYPQSSASNSLTGGVTFAGSGSIAVSVSSNTVSFIGNPATAFSAPSNTRLDTNPGLFRIPVTGVTPSSPAQGDNWYDPYWGGTFIHDGSRAIPESAVGFMPWAFSAGMNVTDVTTTTTTLPTTGGSIAVPIFLDAPLSLQSISIRSLDATLTRIWECALYFETQDRVAVLQRIGGTYVRETFVAAAASTRTVNVDTQGILLPPGVIWAIVRNLHTANTFALGSGAAGTMAGNAAQTKTIAGSQLAANSLDFSAATWAASTTPAAVRLNGRVFGRSTAF